MANIPVPTVTVGTVTDTTIALTWASDAYATWHRVEYSQSANGKRSSGVTVAAAMQTGSGMTVTGLPAGGTYLVRVYSGMGASYYEPHGTAVTVKTAAAGGENFLLFLLSDWHVFSYFLLFLFSFSLQETTRATQGWALVGFCR